MKNNNRKSDVRRWVAMHTLTYHEAWPDDQRDIRRYILALKKRWDVTWAYVTEFRSRVPHYHVYLEEREEGDLSTICKLMSEIWIRLGGRVEPLSVDFYQTTKRAQKSPWGFKVTRWFDMSRGVERRYICKP